MDPERRHAVETPPVVVIGAGAAGLMAALFAARAAHPVLLIERTKDGGRKILISGGGRCNVLPSESRPERFVTASSKNSLAKILRSWPLADQIRFFERELGQPLELEPETGKLFPRSGRARDVRDRLVARIREAGADLWFGTRVTGLSRIGGSDSKSGAARWRVELEHAPPVEARSVVVATGGLSVPATGSDGSGWRWLEGLGHQLNETYPALTPLLADPPVHAGLAGVSLDVTLVAPGVRPRFVAKGGFLFTHRGYSGPVVLDASHLAVQSQDAEPQPLRVAWTSEDRDRWNDRVMSGSGTVLGRVAQHLPKRLAAQLLEEAGVALQCRVADFKKEDRRLLLGLLTDYPLPWTGHEGYKKAEVTGGGVALGEVSPRTLESRLVPGLFLCGEILDAFGPIGGFNFQWAWATGRAAGEAAAASLRGT